MVPAIAAGAVSPLAVPVAWSGTGISVSEVVKVPPKTLVKTKKKASTTHHLVLIMNPLRQCSLLGEQPPFLLSKFFRPVRVIKSVIETEQICAGTKAQRSTLNAQRSTFNVQRSTFNSQLKRVPRREDEAFSQLSTNCPIDQLSDPKTDPLGR